MSGKAKTAAQAQTHAASADRVLSALFELYADCEQVPETLITNVLCDLRHLCDQRSLAFSAADKAGHALYLEELRG